MNRIRQYIFGSVALVALMFTSSVYAITVNQDVTLQTTNGSDITMLANSTFDTLTVGSDSFTFTLSGSQSVTLRDTDSQILKANVSGITPTCNSANSEIILPASKGSSIQVSIEGFACSGGGGGGGGSLNPPSPTPSPAPSPTPTPAPVATPEETTSTYIEGAPPSAIPLETSPLPLPVPVPLAVGLFPGIADINRGLTVGSTGGDVSILQTALASMPDVYPNGLVTGYYGSLTKSAVQKFQMKYGVVSSSADAGYGYVGPLTRQKLKEVFVSGVVAIAPPATPFTSILTRELDPGDEGDDVTQLQIFLAADSSLYPEGLVTGYYGSLTTAAVKRFQAQYGIAQVGRVGPQTMAKLNSVMGGNGIPAPSIGSPSTSGDAATRTALQNQINDLQALMNSLMQQIQSAQ